MVCVFDNKEITKLFLVFDYLIFNYDVISSFFGVFKNQPTIQCHHRKNIKTTHSENRNNYKSNKKTHTHTEKRGQTNTMACETEYGKNSSHHKSEKMR